MTARERILDGATEVLRERGLARATTKEIAQASGLSEAMIYKVFADKTELFLAVLTERLPPITVPGAAVPSARLPATVRGIVRDLTAFYLESFPVAASVFSDSDLLVQHRAALRLRSAGPDQVAAAVARFLDLQRRAAGVRPVVPAGAIADLVVGACLHRAFLVRFDGLLPGVADQRRFVAETARAALALLAPAEGRPPAAGAAPAVTA